MLFAPSAPATGSGLGLDKLVHAGLFAVLAGTTRWRFGSSPALLGAVAGYAVLSEVLQDSGLSRRSGDPYDVVADVVGALAGWLLARRLLDRTRAAD